MNESLKALILGAVQGLTEFLPVSSSGHLEIGKVLLNTNLNADESMLMTVVLHVATALSTVVVFWKSISEILRGVLQFKRNVYTELVAKIAVSMIPAAFVGVVFKDQIESLFNGKLFLVGAMLIVTGILLLLASRSRNTTHSVGFFEAIIVGISQAVAILPGISRSGATISTSVLLGVDRTQAAQFSFLMVIPLIMGKITKDILDGEFAAGTVSFPELAIGFVAAFVTGLFACKWMIALVRNCQLWWFSIYCFVVGAIAMGSVWLTS
jgi:undecaprenyl-diphosphatase